MRARFQSFLCCHCVCRPSCVVLYYFFLLLFLYFSFRANFACCLSKKSSLASLVRLICPGVALYPFLFVTGFFEIYPKLILCPFCRVMLRLCCLVCFSSVVCICACIAYYILGDRLPISAAGSVLRLPCRINYNTYCSGCPCCRSSRIYCKWLFSSCPPFLLYVVQFFVFVPVA